MYGSSGSTGEQHDVSPSKLISFSFELKGTGKVHSCYAKGFTNVNSKLWEWHCIYRKVWLAMIFLACFLFFKYYLYSLLHFGDPPLLSHIAHNEVSVVKMVQFVTFLY